VRVGVVSHLIDHSGAYLLGGGEHEDSTAAMTDCIAAGEALSTVHAASGPAANGHGVLGDRLHRKNKRRLGHDIAFRSKVHSLAHRADGSGGYFTKNVYIITNIL